MTPFHQLWGVLLHQSPPDASSGIEARLLFAPIEALIRRAMEADDKLGRSEPIWVYFNTSEGEPFESPENQDMVLVYLHLAFPRDRVVRLPNRYAPRLTIMVDPRPHA